MTTPSVWVARRLSDRATSFVPVAELVDGVEHARRGCRRRPGRCWCSDVRDGRHRDAGAAGDVVHRGAHAARLDALAGSPQRRERRLDALLGRRCADPRARSRRRRRSRLPGAPRRAPPTCRRRGPRRRRRSARRPCRGRPGSRGRGRRSGARDRGGRACPCRARTRSRRPTCSMTATRVDALPPEVARVEVDAHVRAGRLARAARTTPGCRPRRRRAARGRSARRATAARPGRRARARTAPAGARSCHSQSVSSSGTTGHDAKTGVEPPPRPPGQPLIVTTRSTAEQRGQLDRAAEQRGVALADGRVGVERVAGGVHARRARGRARAARLPAGRARRRSRKQRVEVEVVGLLPAADAHLDVARCRARRTSAAPPRAIRWARPSLKTPMCRCAPGVETFKPAARIF